VLHPAAKMLVDLANAQDIEAGDGTTSVVVIAGSLLGAADRLLEKGSSRHPEDIISDLDRFTSYYHIRSISTSLRGCRQDVAWHVDTDFPDRPTHA
jgi:hypothetical protein